MRLAVLSDTHGNLAHTRAAAAVLRGLQCELVLHCGDVGGPTVIDLLAEWPVHWVAGNVDYDEGELARTAAQYPGHVWHGRLGEMELAGRRLALLHGDDFRSLELLIRGQQHDVICHGHTHVVRQEQIGRTLVLNPGALHRAARHTLAELDLQTLAVRLHAVAVR